MTGWAAFDVAICGASFTGMTLARALARAEGARLCVALIDRSSPMPLTTTADPRATAMSLASNRLFEQLGISRALEPHVQPVRAIDLTHGALDTPFRPVRLSYENIIGDGEPASGIIENVHLARVLRASVEVEPAITRIDAEVVAYSADARSSKLTLADGRTLEAALTVAADGRASALRDFARIKTVHWRYPQTGIVVTVRHARPHEGRAVQHFLPSGPFAILPLPGGTRSSLVWTEDEAIAKRMLALDDAGFLHELDLRFGGRLGQVSLDGPRAAWPLEMHLARQLIAERLALVGDAARVVHPLAGQGLNIGLRDVAALAEISVDSRRLGLDFGGAEPLGRYERWRRFDSAVSAAAMDGLNRLFSNDNAMLSTLRDAGLGIVDRAPGLKRAFVREAAGLSGKLPRLLAGEAL